MATVWYKQVNPPQRKALFSTPLWLASLIRKETLFLHNILSGAKPEEDYIDLLNGEAAMSAIATADAATLSRSQDRKVKISEIIKHTSVM